VCVPVIATCSVSVRFLVVYVFSGGAFPRGVRFLGAHVFSEHAFSIMPEA
jgi:hypothetical protein